MNRRGFLTGALGFLAAPAIVRASSLMPVSPEPLFTSHIGTYEGVRLVVVEPAAILPMWPGNDLVSSAVEDYMQRMSDTLSRTLYGDWSEAGASLKDAFAS